MNLKTGVGDGSVLQLVVGRPNPERNQQGNVVSQAAANLKQLSTLTRNIKECVRCAQRDIEPNQRNRYDTPEEEIPEEPCKFFLWEFTYGTEIQKNPGIQPTHYTLKVCCFILDVRDLGLELERMALTMLTMSHTVEDLGNQLKRDESLTDDPAKYQRARRNIQNNMGKDLEFLTRMLVK